MLPNRIAELLEPFLGPCKDRIPGLIPLISTYIDILLHWNSRINLTAIRDPEQIITRHFGESLFAARHLFPSVSSVVKPLDVADLGSGAGFPGIPIKLWSPHISLTLIESNHKKAVFLREVARALTLTDVNIKNARAESLPPSSFQVVTLRAVECFDKVLPIAARLVAPRGVLCLLIGSAQLDPAKAALTIFEIASPVPVPRSDSRVLLLARRKENLTS